MNGNVFISVPEADIYNELPASITSYDWVEYVYDHENPEAAPTTVNHHPTWDSLGERNNPIYGDVVTVTVGEDVFKVYELTASWKEGEVSALLALGAGLAAPSYTLMTAQEAKAFISANAPTLE